MRKTDKPWKSGKQRKKRQVCAALLMAALVSLTGCGRAKDDLTITNVSYDPTREFYEKYNELFESYYQDTYGETVNVIQSHGGSGAQARSVVEGCNADVVTLALEHDITLIERTGLITRAGSMNLTEIPPHIHRRSCFLCAQAIRSRLRTGTI